MKNVGEIVHRVSSRDETPRVRDRKHPPPAPHTDAARPRTGQPATPTPRRPAPARPPEAKVESRWGTQESLTLKLRDDGPIEFRVTDLPCMLPFAFGLLVSTHIRIRVHRVSSHM